jgi:hypothetical protein
MASPPANSRPAVSNVFGTRHQAGVHTVVTRLLARIHRYCGGVRCGPSAPAPLIAAQTDAVPVPMKMTSTPVPLIDARTCLAPVPVKDSAPAPLRVLP